MESLVTTTGLMLLANTLPSFCANSQTYEEISGLRDLATSDDSLVTKPALSMIECGIWCLREPSCTFFMFLEGTCSFYGSQPKHDLDTSGDDPGTVFFGHLGETKPSTCPVSSGYRYVEDPRLCFKVRDDTYLEFEDAQTQCEFEGGRLIVLSDNHTFDYVTQWLIDEASATNYWVGLNNTDMNGAGEYMWADGSTNVRKWAPWEPMMYDCAKMAVDRLAAEDTGLAGEPCYYENEFICEITVF